MLQDKIVVGCLYAAVAGVAASKPEITGGADGDGDGGTTLVVEGKDRDTSSCAGRQGVNLKGELLNDGSGGLPP